MKRQCRVSLPVTLLLALAVLAASGDRAIAQRVSTLWNGSIEARFGNGCVVRYDSRGRRTGSRPDCRNDQIREADRTVAAYVDRGQGEGAGSRPRVVMQANGAGEVRFRGPCTVYYRRNGERDRADQSCSREQRRLADDTMARYRREHGLDRPSGGRPGIGAPRATILESGFGLVTFGDGCRVEYGIDGRRREANRRCTADQVSRADEAMRRHREEHGPAPGTGRK